MMGVPQARVVPVDRLHKDVRRDRRVVGRPDHDRPRTRAECPVERPCPFAGCRYHLYLDVEPNGAIRFNFPGVPLERLGDSCALDVADRGERDEDRTRTLAAAGRALGISRERVRQLCGDIVRRLVLECDDLIEELRPPTREPWEWRGTVHAVSPWRCE